MDEGIKKRLATVLLAMADDELILAHRNAEWTGHAPILEEDIAYANIAQDELGHATLWYGLLADLLDDDPDRLVFFRDASEFRNCQLFELPNGDWSRSMLRQFLFDAFELVRSPFLVQSAYEPIAHAAAKIESEEIYHYRHTSSWIRRLGWGTDESNGRMQNSLDFLWPFAQQLFAESEGDRLLADVNVLPGSSEIKVEWEKLVVSFLEESNLVVPSVEDVVLPDRAEHTNHLDELVQEMQSVARSDLQARW